MKYVYLDRKFDKFQYPAPSQSITSLWFLNLLALVIQILFGGRLNYFKLILAYLEDREE